MSAEAVAAESAQGAVCEAANDNGAGQVVVSGDKAAVERAVEIAKAKGAKRAMLLPVSAPFHCALMAPAAEAMAEALAAVTIRPPAVPLVANVKAAAVTDPGEIARLLVAQVTGTVRWRECVSYMAAHGATRFYEVGAGKVLSAAHQAHRRRCHRNSDRHAGGHRGVRVVACTVVRLRARREFFVANVPQGRVMAGLVPATPIVWHGRAE